MQLHVIVLSYLCIALLSSREGKVLLVTLVDRDPLVVLDPQELTARKALSVRTM